MYQFSSVIVCVCLGLSWTSSADVAFVTWVSTVP